MRIALLSLVLFVSFQAFADINGKLVAGPMQGHTTATTTAIWIMVKNVEQVSLTLTSPDGQKFSQTGKTEGIASYRHQIPMTFNFEGLSPSTTYTVSINLDGKKTKLNHTVYTLGDDPNQAYSFSVLSCAMYVPPGLKFMNPGIEDRTYKYMCKNKSDFALWLGDYLYYLPRNTRSPQGMGKRFVFKRNRHKMMTYMTSRPQYSMWDDHDYGPNNSDSTFKYKKESLEIFKQFWPNPYSNDLKEPGNYFNFRQYDSEFFMTDDRYYRTEPDSANSEMLGKTQLEWLEQQLLASTATFKFVCIGSQTLNTESHHECWWRYPNELDHFLDFIVAHKISGVIFLTGDRHHSEVICQKDLRGCYPLYDFTSSGVTSFRSRTRRTKEAHNPLRIEGTLADYQNFARIRVNGSGDDRYCVLECFNKRGKRVFQYKIMASELKF